MCNTSLIILFVLAKMVLTIRFFEHYNKSNYIMLKKMLPPQTAAVQKLRNIARVIDIQKSF